MNSKVKGIIICAVVIVCLGVTLLVLNLTANNDENSEETSSSVADSEETISLIGNIADDLDNSYVKMIKVKNENDSFRIDQVKSDEWEIEALSGIDQSNTVYSGFASIAACLSATDIIEEEASDLSKYGLSDPSVEFTIQFTDDNNTKKTFLIGDMSPNNSDYYLCEKGDNTVYTVSSGNLSYFFYTKEDFISLTMLESPESDDDYPDYIKEVISDKGLDYNIVLENPEERVSYMSSAQVMTEPIYAYLDATNSTEITHGMWGLTASAAVKAHPGKKDFKKYGIDDPITKVALYTSDGTYTLSVGDPVYAKDSDGKDTSEVEYYYAYLDGVSGKDVVFKVSADSLPWVGVKPSDFISSLMTYNAATDLKSVTVDDGEEKTVFKLRSIVDPDAEDDEDDENDEDEEPTMKLESVKLNGEDLDVEAWKGWYQYLLQCPTTEVYFTEPETECYLTISINRNDGNKDVLKFFKDTNRRTIVKLNGKTSYRIESSYVKKLLSNMELAIEGQEINTDF